MAFLADEVFDDGLSQLNSLTENLYIDDDTADPTTFTLASATYKCGTKASPTVAVPADRTGGGRQATISAITDGVVDATATAKYWALCDNSASLLLAWGLLSATQGVTATNTFTLTSFEIGIPDPA